MWGCDTVWASMRAQLRKCVGASRGGAVVDDDHIWSVATRGTALVADGDGHWNHLGRPGAVSRSSLFLQPLRSSEVRPCGEQYSPCSITLLKSWLVCYYCDLSLIIVGQWGCVWHLVAWRAVVSCVCFWIWKCTTAQIKDRSQALARTQSRSVGQGASACSPVGWGSLGNQAGL